MQLFSHIVHSQVTQQNVCAQARICERHREAAESQNVSAQTSSSYTPAACSREETAREEHQPLTPLGARLLGRGGGGNVTLPQPGWGGTCCVSEVLCF